MNKLYILILSFIVLFSFSCSDDDCDLIHDSDIMGTPNIVKGSFPDGVLTPKLGEEIVFSPELKNAEKATFSWLINGIEVSTEPTYTYKVENPCRANVECKITNDLGTAVLKTEIVSKQDFSKGFLFIEEREVGFYDASTGKVYHNCYSSLNYGSKIAYEGSIMASVVNDKIYFTIYNSVTNYDHVVIADAKTLYKTNVLRGSTGYLSFTPLNKQYALISTFYNAYRLDMNTNQIVTFTKKLAHYIFSGITFNGKLLTNATYRGEQNVWMYDINELISASEDEFPVAEKLDIIQNKKSNFVLGKDGDLYTTAISGTMSQLVKIKSDFSTETIDLSFNISSPGWYELNYKGIAASQTENAIFIPADNGAIYKYSIGDGSSLTKPFISAPEGNLKLYGTGVQVHPETGEVYVLYSEKSNGKITIYNASGDQIKVIESEGAIPQSIIFAN
ncbi:MAG: DUF5074 domain-containing protein [Dysgonomonas sp.]|nr:DUF5074 domain-containing protein [Dysgonomonas sp.]